MRRAAVELSLVLVNAAAFGVCDSLLHAKGPFIAVTGLFWIGYMLVRSRREPGVWRRWGFGAKGLWPATCAAAAAVAAGSAAMLCYGLLHGRVNVPPSFWVLAVLYLPWALLQQFLLNAMVAANMVELLDAAGIDIRTRTVAAVVVTAALFGLVHLPDRALTLLCCCGGAVWVAIYLRWRNLWPLGVSHVILGAIAYYVVVRRDPLAEIAAAVRTLVSHG